MYRYPFSMNSHESRRRKEAASSVASQATKVETPNTKGCCVSADYEYLRYFLLNNQQKGREETDGINREI